MNVHCRIFSIKIVQKQIASLIKEAQIIHSVATEMFCQFPCSF